LLEIFRRRFNGKTGHHPIRKIGHQNVMTKGVDEMGVFIS